MARRGRLPSPRAASAKAVHIKSYVCPGEDDDLIAFFSAIIPRLRAAMGKRAFRSGVQTGRDQGCDIGGGLLMR